MAPLLPTRQLGKDGPPVTAIGFGAMGLSGFYGPVDSDSDRFKLLDRAYSLGETFWDSADIYLDSEELIGKWFRRTGKRDDIFLATKFGIVWKDGTASSRGDAEYVKEACERSLARLGISTIDLYYLHRVDTKTPIEKTVAAMAELKKEGKINHLGLSEVSSSTLRRAHAIHPISAVQVEYSPFTTDIESPRTALLATCRSLGVAVVAYSPLGRGMLTGAYRSPADFSSDDFRRFLPRYSEENFPKNLKLLDTLAAIARKKGCTAGQLTLAWLLAQGEDIIPIPGTKKVRYLEENVGAVRVEVSKEEEAAIRKAVENAEVHGGRYPEQMAAALFGDTPELS